AAAWTPRDDAEQKMAQMTEREWLEGSDPRPMLEYLFDKASDRKFRLFAVAFCRSLGHRLPDALAGNVVELTERYADGEATPEELMKARAAALEAQWSGEGPSPEAVCACDAAYHEDIQQVVAASAEWYCQQVPAGERRQAEAVQCEILRDLFYPFGPVSLHPSWRTPGVVGLARAIHEERA